MSCIVPQLAFRGRVTRGSGRTRHFDSTHHAITPGQPEVIRFIRIGEGRLRKRTVRKPLKSWSVLIPSHHEGYITWDQFELVSRMITHNSQRCFSSVPGAAKKGLGLLAGLVRCRKCGRKLMVSYTGQEHDKVRYLCRRGALDQGEAKCISFGGTAADEAIAREVLRVLEPAAVEAAAQAARHKTEKEDEVLRVLSLELQAARYEAERAQAGEGAVRRA
jgi:Recombinase zinc beta ribbon domain